MILECLDLASFRVDDVAGDRGADEGVYAIDPR